jgi:beta-1,4-mannooligosaccharide/beta-1,4-mannosyl-N-acetylglucosamine phosphorylase
MSNNDNPLKRHESNPILTPDDMPFRCYSVYNAGATWFNDKVLLLLRIERCDRKTYFHVATSDDGLHFDVSPEPINYPRTLSEERFGDAHRFDMRITYLDDVYYVCHAAVLPGYGCCIGMAKTTDFVNFEPMPYVSEPANRNAVLFPEKIDGMYVRLDRPGGRIWCSWSPDLEFWGRSMPLNLPAVDWANIKSGAGAIPIKTEHGWLEIYHTVCGTCSTDNYHLGVALLDLKDPSKVIAAPTEFILAAEKDYECMGQTPNVVFTSGAIEMPDGTLNVYYAGADTRVCLATTTVDDLVQYCLRSKEA